MSHFTLTSAAKGLNSQLTRSSLNIAAAAPSLTRLRLGTGIVATADVAAAAVVCVRSMIADVEKERSNGYKVCVTPACYKHLAQSR
jgi:hypothetical protein